MNVGGSHAHYQIISMMLIICSVIRIGQLFFFFYRLPKYILRSQCIGSYHSLQIRATAQDKKPTEIIDKDHFLKTCFVLL